MIFRRRNRFGELLQRQLDLFAEDESDLFDELEAAERAYDTAHRDEAEEAYSDLQLVLDAAAERLVEVRDSYAATLDEDAAEEYRDAFARAAAKRFPRLTGLL